VVYLLLAAAVAVLGMAFARSASPATVTGLTQFSNAAGILTRVLTVIDAVRAVATWSAAGSQGPGPLTVPVPVAGRALEGRVPPQGPPRPRPATVLPATDTYDPYANDPVGRELGLPPRMDTTQPPSAVLGGGIHDWT